MAWIAPESSSSRMLRMTSCWRLTRESPSKSGETCVQTTQYVLKPSKVPWQNYANDGDVRAIWVVLRVGDLRYPFLSMRPTLVSSTRWATLNDVGSNAAVIFSSHRATLPAAVRTTAPARGLRADGAREHSAAKTARPWAVHLRHHPARAVHVRQVQ